MSKGALFEAVGKGDVATVKTLVDADPSLLGARTADGTTALRLAIYVGKEELASWLGAAGAELDVFDAAATGEVERLEALLQHHPERARELSGDGWTALHLAAFFGHAKAAKLLLDAGASTEVTARNGQGNTPLHAAVAGRHPDVVEALLAAQANPNARELRGLTPLHLAAHRVDVALVRRLLDAGAPPDVGAHDGRRARDMIGEGSETDLATLRALLGEA